ncbi:MAG: hypothetical protein QM817_20345 [Archangium sp.]
MRALPLLVLFAALPAFAAEEASDAGVAPQADAGTAAQAQTMLVMNLETNDDAKALSPVASQDLAFRLQSPTLHVLTQADITAALGRERQAEILGCDKEQGSCLIELGQALGSRYIVSGRLDKLGAHVVFMASVFDAQANTVLIRAREEFDAPEALPATTKKIADTLLGAIGVVPAAPAVASGSAAAASTGPSKPNAMGLNLGLRLGTQFITSIIALSPQIDLEFAWRFNLAWSAFFQISSGFTFAPELTATITPGLLGVRYNFRSDSMFQPVVGGGIGLYGAIRSGFAIRPSVVLFGGAQFFPIPRLGISLEASLDALAAAFDLFGNMKSGVNLGISLGVLYRF